MTRVLKRVPFNFEAPLKKVWEGYNPSEKIMSKHKFPIRSCQECESKNKDREDFCKEEKTPYCIFHNSNWKNLWFYDPPIGEGYQLWEYTSDGSPVTPVFRTAEELAEYCEKRVPIFGISDFVSKEEWLEMINKQNFDFTQGDFTFI